MKIEGLEVEVSNFPNYNVLATRLGFSTTKAIEKRPEYPKDFYGEIKKSPEFNYFMSIFESMKDEELQNLRSTFVYGPENFQIGLERLKADRKSGIEYTAELAEKYGRITLEFDFIPKTKKREIKVFEMTDKGIESKTLILTQNKKPDIYTRPENDSYSRIFRTDTFTFFRTDSGVRCIRVYIGTSSRASEIIDLDEKVRISEYRHVYAIADLTIFK